MRGRKPVPKAIRELKMDPAARHNAILKAAGQQPLPVPEEETVDSGPLNFEVPDWLEGNQIELYKRVVESHMRQRIARQTDLLGYARWAVYMAKWLEMKTELDKPVFKKVTPKSAIVERKSAEFQVLMDIESVLVKLEDRLCINPTARQSYIRGLAAVPSEKPAGPAKLHDKTGAKEEKSAPRKASPIGALQRSSERLQDQKLQ